VSEKNDALSSYKSVEKKDDWVCECAIRVQLRVEWSLYTSVRRRGQGLNKLNERVLFLLSAECANKQSWSTHIAYFLGEGRKRHFDRQRMSLVGDRGLIGMRVLDDT
jgi:hypothetical protein